MIFLGDLAQLHLLEELLFTMTVFQMRQNRDDRVSDRKLVSLFTRSIWNHTVAAGKWNSAFEQKYVIECATEKLTDDDSTKLT